MKDCIHITPPQRSVPAKQFSLRGLATLIQACAAAFDVIHVWQERARQRHQLLVLDNRMLKDIGLSRVDAEREARKPFWRA